MLITKKIQFIAIYIAIIFNALPISAQSFSGEGTEASPYLIKTVGELQQLATDLENGIKYTNKYIRLVNDLNLDSVCGSNINGNDLSWTPIGTSSIPFNGHFDGNNLTISNLYINNQNYSLCGLFGFIQNATITNLNLVGTNITGYSETGSICGRANESTISYCTNNGSLVGINYYTGGICGLSYGSHINNCTNNSDIKGKSNAGGICGCIYPNTEINYCINTGSINIQTQNAGRICAHALATTSIKGCINIGNINDSSRFAGGICGLVSSNATINYCINSGNINNVMIYAGGICGIAENNATLSYCFNNGSVSSNVSAGGITGNNCATITSCYYDKQMCNLPYGNGSTTGLGTEGNSDNSEGRLTTKIIDNNLKDAENGDGWTSDNFIFSGNLYPRIKGIENADASLIAASPVILAFNDLNNYQSVDSISTNFSVSTANNVTWTNLTKYLTINGSSASPVSIGKDTLTATLNNVSKTIAINIANPITGKDDISQNVINIYPNPTTNGFFIDLGDKKSVVSIYDQTGNLIDKMEVKGKQFIDISNYTQGIYIVKAFYGNTWKVTKK